MYVGVTPMMASLTKLTCAELDESKVYTIMFSYDTYNNKYVYIDGNNILYEYKDSQPNDDEKYHFKFVKAETSRDGVQLYRIQPANSTSSYVYNNDNGSNAKISSKSSSYETFDRWFVFVGDGGDQCIMHAQYNDEVGAYVRTKKYWFPSISAESMYLYGSATTYAPDNSKMRIVEVSGLGGNEGGVTPEFTYESLDKPTFKKGGNTTKVAMVELDGENQSGFTYTQGQTTRFNMPQVVAGQTYNLDLTYEMAWGDLAIFQIDKNSNEKKYGYYTCVWEAYASPFAILVEKNRDFMCQELEIPSIESLKAISANDATYLTIPYKITIPENLEAGDIVVVRVMVGKKDGAYNAKDISEGGCLDLVFEVKKSHTLTVGSAGYATLFLDYNAAIPENLEAYTVTEVNDGYAKLNLVEGVLPANTGVIVKASAANYSFDASTEEPTEVTGNLLKGSVGDDYVEGAAYVLGILDGNVGLYSAKLNKNATGGEGNTHFLNNAYKAYLPASALTSNANMLRFDFSGETTGVEEVEVESTVKTIYDLSGRKVSSMSAPGLYIVNGKKVLVK